MSHRLDPSTTDDALVHEIRRIGSETAFCLLYERHTPRLFQAVWRILGGAEHDAEDAVQESWVRAIGSLSAWRGDAPFGAWVRGIAIHVAIDVLRRQRQLADPTDYQFSDESSDTRLDLESAIASLAPGYRAVLVLHDIEGFTHEEIARKLGITAGTSKGQLFKARRAMRERLEPARSGTTGDER